MHPSTFSLVALVARLFLQAPTEAGAAAPTAIAAASAPSPCPAAGPKNYYRGRTVVISGAEGGIGFELTKQLVARGAVVFAGVRHDPPSPAMQALQQACPQALHVHLLDVTDANGVQAFRQAISTPQVDVLINNAGINVDERFRLMNLPEDRLQKTFNVNASGPVRLTQAIYPLLHNCGRPVVANITSVMGSIGDNQTSGSPSYRMSKAALNMFTRSLAVEEPTLTVLSLHPGWVKTKMGGGERADIEPSVSVRGILKIIAGAGRKQSGHFYRYSGQPIPW